MATSKVAKTTRLEALKKRVEYMAAILNSLNFEDQSIKFNTITLDTENILQRLKCFEEKVAKIDALVSSGIA